MLRVVPLRRMQDRAQTFGRQPLYGVFRQGAWGVPPLRPSFAGRTRAIETIGAMDRILYGRGVSRYVLAWIVMLTDKS
jgi:hypothetical protein